MIKAIKRFFQKHPTKVTCDTSDVPETSLSVLIQLEIGRKLTDGEKILLAGFIA